MANAAVAHADADADADAASCLRPSSVDCNAVCQASACDIVGSMADAQRCVGRCVLHDGCLVQCPDETRRPPPPVEGKRLVPRARDDELDSGGSAATTAMPQLRLPDNETLLLSDVDFNALFPTSLAAFPSLRRFSCRNCRLSRFPVALFELRNLSECALPRNQLQALPVQLESSAINMLDLSHNRFSSMPPEAWSMPQLSALDLSGNAISECETPARPDILSRLQSLQLRELALDGNPLTSFRCIFPNLESLSLRKTALGALPLVFFNMSQLQRLDISESRNLSLDALSQPLAITELYVSLNEWRSLPPSLPTLTPQLETLVARDNLLQDVTDLKIATRLPRLRALELSGNRMRSLVEVAETFPALEVLGLSRSNATAFVMSSPHDSLQRLDVAKNPIEPWLVTPTQLTFLQRLETLRIDQTAFASCATSSQRVVHGYKVCLSTAPSALYVPDAKEKQRNQLIYILGSVMVALLIGIFVAYSRKQRSCGPNAAQSLAGANGDDVSLASSMRQSSQVRKSMQERPSAMPVKFFSQLSRSRSNRSDLSSSRDSSSRGSSTNAFLRLPAPPTTRGGGDNPLSTPTPLVLPGHTTMAWENEELLSWHLDHDGVRMEKRLAVGRLVEIWRASYRTDTVVVKRIKPSVRLLFPHNPQPSDVAVIDAFLHEIRLLSRLDHPRIVAFYGAAWTSVSDVMAVMEYLPHQDIHSFLSRDPRRRSSRSSAMPAPFRAGVWGVEKVRLALGVAEALACLHAFNPPLVHGDVQARNVLLDDELQPKLCDFGSARYCVQGSTAGDAGSLYSSVADGSVDSDECIVRGDNSAWLAPEVLLGRATCDPSMDVYAFGVFLAELDTHDLPIPMGSGAARDSQSSSATVASIRQQIVMGAWQPTFTAACDPQVRALATQCLAFAAAARPSSADIVGFLRELLAEWGHPSRTTATTTLTSASGGAVGATLHDSNGPADSEDSLSLSDFSSQRTIEFKRFDTP
ncbi:hypothetical protein P43SY_000634 [Pythium insidiosum]|uniref:Protein kinase domain-containing protein n=1 Tax=Pythium insidiosum TaxID=114742 RepID=A0AAD5L981_PYTIN|nr:hypothetical protein P43SY_000634 [Pythium insidiosum]